MAAFTIPTTINNTKEQELKSQFKKAYSTISQALYKTVMNDFYGCLDCNYTVNAQTGGYDYSNTKFSDCPHFYNALAKNLQVQKVCRGNSLADGCVPEYQLGYSSGCSGYNQNSINNLNYSYVLADGMVMISYSTNTGPLFLVDINGHKGPNAFGKDLFTFEIAVKTDEPTIYYLSSGNCEDLRVPGGKTTKEMIRYALAGKK